MQVEARHRDKQLDVDEVISVYIYAYVCVNVCAYSYMCACVGM